MEENNGKSREHCQRNKKQVTQHEDIATQKCNAQTTHFETELEDESKRHHEPPRHGTEQHKLKINARNCEVYADC